MVVLSVMMPLSMIIRFKHNLYATILLDLPIFVSATASVSFFYVATQREIGATWWERIKYLPFLMSLGLGMAVNQTKAVLEALFDRQSDFARTPKTGSEGRAVLQVKKAYRGKRNWAPFVEITFGLYFTAAIYYALDHNIWPSLPYLFLFQMGFLYVGILSLVEFRPRATPPKSEVTVDAEPGVAA
jgi:hypothetical protein